MYTDPNQGAGMQTRIEVAEEEGDTDTLLVERRFEIKDIIECVDRGEEKLYGVDDVIKTLKKDMDQNPYLQNEPKMVQ